MKPRSAPELKRWASKAMRILLAIVVCLAFPEVAFSGKQAGEYPTHIPAATAVHLRLSNSRQAYVIDDPVKVGALVAESNKLRLRKWKAYHVKHGCAREVIFLNGKQRLSKLVVYQDRVFEVQFGHPHPSVGASATDLPILYEAFREAGLPSVCK